MIKYNLILEKNKDFSDEFASDIWNIPKENAERIDRIFNLRQMPEEHFILICLDNKLQLVGAFDVAVGTLSGVLVHQREIFKRALLCNAARILVGHNHTSGNTAPSSEDITLTERLKKSGDIMGIPIIDHIIIGETYYSFHQNHLVIGGQK